MGQDRQTWKYKHEIVTFCVSAIIFAGNVCIHVY